MGPQRAGEIFFREKDTLRRKNIMSNQKDALHPGRISTQNS